MSLQQISLIVSLLQQMCVYVVIVYLLSKTPLFQPLTQVTIRLPNKILCYLIFSAFCIMGTYFGLRIENSIANTRATGAVLVPCITRMLPGGQGYRVEIGTPWTDYPSDDLTVDVARINACIEAAVRTMPEQYLWVHRRFKKQPHGTKAPY